MRTDVCQHNDSTIIPDGIRKLRINIVVIFCKKEKIYNIAAGISLLVQNNPTGDASHKFYSRFSQTVYGHVSGPLMRPVHLKSRCTQCENIKTIIMTGSRRYGPIVVSLVSGYKLIMFDVG